MRAPLKRCNSNLAAAAVTMLTAARTSEALLAEWREFDLDGAVWTVPAERMKGRQEAHRAPVAGGSCCAARGARAQTPGTSFRQWCSTSD